MSYSEMKKKAPHRLPPMGSKGKKPDLAPSSAKPPRANVSLPTPAEQLAYIRANVHLLDGAQGANALAKIEQDVQHLYELLTVKHGNEKGCARTVDSGEETTALAVKQSGEQQPPLLLHIHLLPDELLCLIMECVDAKTLMIVVPQVCKRWRCLCPQLQMVSK